MKQILTTLCVLTLVFGVGLMPADAYSQRDQHYTYSYGNYNNSGHLESLLRELRSLQAELDRLRGGSYCYGSGCYERSTRRGDLRSADVIFRSRVAQVEIEYRDGDTDTYILNTTNRTTVINFIMDKTDASHAEVVRLTDFNSDSWDDWDDHDNDEDVEDIDALIDRSDDETRVTVRYEDDERDRFTYDTTSKSEIVEELSEDIDLDEDEIEDIIDYSYTGSTNDDDEDVESIDVEIDEDDNDAEARVEFEDGDVTTYFIDEDDEDEIIEELADLLDMDEEDIEDIIDFDYN